MPSKTPRKPSVEIRCYSFSCPECGMSDRELGYLATHDEMHCLVCLIDDGQHVRVRRWIVESPDPVDLA